MQEESKYERKEDFSMEKSTMSVQDLAREMGISLPKAYELVKQKGFPVLKLGKRYVIPTESFRKWLIQNTNTK